MDSSRPADSSDRWFERYREIVSGDIRARRSRDALIGLGMDFEEISGLLRLSCEFENNPAFTLIERMRANALRQAGLATRLAKRLKDDREMLRGLTSSVPESTLLGLSDAAETLQMEAEEVRKMFSRHKLNTSFFLSWLLSSIEEKTGSPHYRDVSDLLDCAYIAYSMESPSIGEEALRKMHRRFMRGNPFKEWLSPEGKKNLAIGAVIFFILQSVQNLSSGTQKQLPSQGSQPNHEKPSSLLDLFNFPL